MQTRPARVRMSSGTIFLGKWTPVARVRPRGLAPEAQRPKGSAGVEEHQMVAVAARGAPSTGDSSRKRLHEPEAVSYTHLTLPTTD